MKKRLIIKLRVTTEQERILGDLQALFAEVCNVISCIAIEHRCYNRVALHHLTYSLMRQKFPQIGSQMVCNAIYAVTKVTKLLFLTKTSPLYLIDCKQENTVRCFFLKDFPVHFDKNTLSIKGGKLCLFTLVGRLLVNAQLDIDTLKMIKSEKVSELIMKKKADGYQLHFIFDGKEEQSELNQYIKIEVANACDIKEVA